MFKDPILALLITQSLQSFIAPILQSKIDYPLIRQFYPCNIFNCTRSSLRFFFFFPLATFLNQLSCFTTVFPGELLIQRPMNVSNTSIYGLIIMNILKYTSENYLHAVRSKMSNPYKYSEYVFGKFIYDWRKLSLNPILLFV